MTISVKKTRSNILTLLIVFIIFLILGVLFSKRFTTVSSQYSLNSFKVIHLNWLAEIIFRNTMAFLILSSTFFLGNVISVVFFCINGFNVGLVCGQLSIFQSIVLLSPHGIIEITSYLWLVYAVTHANHIKTNIIRAYCLLLLAAIIEIFVTPELALWFLGD